MILAPKHPSFIVAWWREEGEERAVPFASGGRKKKLVGGHTFQKKKSH
jgi:hypothetical protein